MGNKMNFTHLNPIVRYAAVYEAVNRTDECVGYDSRLIYMISGDLSVSAGGEKFSHLGAGNLLFIPAGTPYKMKSKYLKAAVFNFDLTDLHSDEIERIPPVPTAEYDKEKAHLDGVLPPFDRVIKPDDFEADRESF